MINNLCKRTFSTAGRLATWGETTYGWGRTVNDNIRTPGFVQGFNDITQVSTGPYHLTFISKSAGVHSVGLGKNGRLGHNSSSDAQSPQKIQFFASNKIAISQVACGTRHSLAVSADGQVFSWGFGGGSPNTYSFTKWFRTASPLGHGVNVDSYYPQQIELLKNQKIKSVTAGSDFSIALAQSGKVFGWGCGLLTHGLGSYSIPRQIEAFSDLCHKKHSEVKKIASADSFTFVLLQNGSLFTFGINNGGVLATRHNPLIKTDKSLTELTKVNDHFYKGQRVEDFAISGNSLIILTNNGNVLYSGMFLKYRPQPFPKSGNVKKIFATYDSVGFIDGNNKIHFINDQILQQVDKNHQVYTCEQPALQGDIIDIGGSFTLRYALVGK